MSLNAILHQSDEWLSRNRIGYNPGQRALRDPSKRQLLKDRVDFPYISETRYQELVGNGLIASHWTLGTEFKHIVINVLGMSIDQ